MSDLAIGEAEFDTSKPVEHCIIPSDKTDGINQNTEISVFSAFQSMVSISHVFVGNLCWTPRLFHLHDHSEVAVTQTTLARVAQEVLPVAENFAHMIITYTKFAKIIARTLASFRISTSADIEQSTFVDNRILSGKGGIIALMSGSILNIRLSTFIQNFAPEGGGAIFAIQGSICAIQSCTFLNNTGKSAAVAGGTLYLDQPSFVHVLNTTFVPFRDAKTVFLAGQLAGCFENPCDAGHSCIYEKYSITCSPCVYPSVSVDGMMCDTCPSGMEPNRNLTNCTACDDGTYWTFGICNDCPDDSIASSDHSTCQKCPMNQLRDGVEQIDDAKENAEHGDEGRRSLRLGSSGTGTGGTTASGGNSFGDSAGDDHVVASDEATSSDMSGEGGYGSGVSEDPVRACTCAKGYYNTSRDLKCHGGDFSTSEPAVLECAACDVLVQCVISCHGEHVAASPGWAVLRRADATNYLVLSIFQCKHANACPGGVVTGDEWKFRGLGMQSDCSPGYTGTLCGVCEPNYTLDAEGCTECGTGTWIGIVVTVVAVVALAILATKVRVWFNYFTLLQDAVELAGELQIKALGKIVVALGQIVGGLTDLLNVAMPVIFHDFLSHFMSIFKFDITLALGIGCFSDGNYLFSLFTNFAIVCSVVLAVGVVYIYQKFHLHRNPPDVNSPKGQERLRAFFARFDKDGDGSVDLAELQLVLQRIDPSVSAASAVAIFKTVDVDRDGNIDYEEFTSAITKPPLNLSKLTKHSGTTDTEKLRQLFSHFDENGDGLIQLSEMQAAVKKIDPSISMEVVQAIFTAVDTDGSGFIDFDEFYTAITKPAMDLRMLALKAENAEIGALCLSRLFLLFFLLYPGMTAKIFQVFACRELGLGDSILHADYNVDCNSTMALRWIGGNLLVLIWPIGLPACLFFFMYKVRHKIMADDEDTVRQFEFVLDDYNKEHWYWEVN
jgi:predicted outer membrane repeat protein